MCNKCRYLFQDAEKFEGKQYCTFFDELCEELDFICPDNCQTYENEKALQKVRELALSIINTPMILCPAGHKIEQDCTGCLYIETGEDSECHFKVTREIIKTVNEVLNDNSNKAGAAATTKG